MPRAFLAAAAFLVLAPMALRAEPSPDRQAELIHRVKHDCGSCHGMTLKGGLGPSLLPTAMNQWPEESLVEVILHGVEDTPMPPWAFEINRDEASWIVRRLKEGLNQ